MGSQSRRWTTFRDSVSTLYSRDADILQEGDELNDSKNQRGMLDSMSSISYCDSDQRPIFINDVLAFNGECQETAGCHHQPLDEHSDCSLKDYLSSQPSAIMCDGRGRRVRARVDVTDDRISQLPDTLLTQILSLLPVKTVIRTSVLSRRWIPLWTTVPSLDLSDSDFLPRGNGINRMRRQANFLAFVQHFLRRNSPCYIKTLHLDCPAGKVPTDISDVKLVLSQVGPQDNENHPRYLEQTPRMCQSNLESWIVLAEQFKVLELTISCSEDMIPSCQIRPSFYKFESLVFLELHGYVVLKVPIASIIFPKLKTLLLMDIISKDNYSVSNLINYCCPVLDELFLCSDNEDDFDRLVITAKTLTHLDIVFKDFFDTVSRTRIDVPALQFLSLQNVLTTDNDVAEVMGALEEVNLDVSTEDDLSRLMLRIRNVKKLTLSEFTLMSLDSCTFPIFHNLICIETEEQCDASPSWELLFKILNNSPILEDLRLEQILIDNRTFDWTSGPDIPRCLTNCLKMIEINFIYGEKKELKILGYFLKHSQVLQKMKVLIDKKCPKKDKIMERILALPKGSPECDVIVMETRF